MRTAVIASRGFTDKLRLYLTLCKENISELVYNDHTPVGHLCQDWASDQFKPCRVRHLDNANLVSECDQLIAFWNGRSPGTRKALREASRKGIPVKIIRV
jgi:hypothetical protein